MPYSIKSYSTKPVAEMFQLNGRAIKVSHRQIHYGHFSNDKFDFEWVDKRDKSTQEELDKIDQWLDIEHDPTEDFDKELLAVLERHQSEWAI